MSPSRLPIEVRVDAAARTSALVTAIAELVVARARRALLTHGGRAESDAERPLAEPPHAEHPAA